MPKIIFSNNKQEAEAKKGSDLKETTKAKGWPIAYGCEDGVCGTCIVEIEEGAENLNPMDEQEKQTLDIMSMNDGKHRLACKCKVNGDLKIKAI